MARATIPVEHLVHLLEEMADDHDDTKQVIGGLRSFRKGARGDALAILETVQPGISDALAETWPYTTHRTVHLFRLPFLEGKSVQQALVKPHGLTLDQWNAVASDPPDDEDEPSARVHRVRPQKGLVRARVRITTPKGYTHEDEREMRAETHDIATEIDFTRRVRIAEVVGGFVDSWFSILTFVEWATGETIPKRKTKDRDSYLVPVGFKESNIKKLARTLKLGNATSLRGRDVTKTVGTVQMWGEHKGDRREPLDIAKKSVAQQDGANNELRHYNLQFEHDDGWTEETEVGFDFVGRQPRVIFFTRTSTPAMKYLIDNLCVELGLT